MNCRERVGDLRWSWIVLVACFLLEMIAIGTSNSSGLFILEFMNTFESQHSDTALIASLQMGFTYLVGAPFGTYISRKYSHRACVLAAGVILMLSLLVSGLTPVIAVLYITYGILSGTALGMIYVSCFEIVCLYFNTRRTFALGLIVTGAGVGNLTFPLLFHLLIEHYSWRGALLIIAGICFNACVFGMLLLPITFWNPKSGLEQDCSDGREPSRKRVWCAPLSVVPLSINFGLIFLNNLLYSFSVSTVVILLPDYARSCSISRNLSAFLLSIYGLSSTVGRFATAALMNYLTQQKYVTSLYSLSIAVCSIAVMFLPVGKIYVSLAVLCALFGFAYGGLCVTLPAVVLHQFGIEKLSVVYGSILIACGVGFLAGSPFAGWMYQITDGYSIPFYINGAVLALAVIALIPLCEIPRRKPTSFLSSMETSF